MNVSLTPELETLISQKVKSGRYHSASEVVREALRLLEEQDRLKEIRQDELRREIQKGVDDMLVGRYKTVSNQSEADEIIKDIIQEGKETLARRK